MSPLPKALYTAAQTRELDRLAIAGGIEGYALMSRAGLSAWNVLKNRWPSAKRIVVLAGTGNNGGDGYVLARLAANEGYDVKLIQLGDHSRLKGEALTAFNDTPKDVVSTFNGTLPTADVYVDAIFGTGLNKPVAGDAERVIKQLNASNTPVFALDIPSGLSADTGAELGVAVNGDATLSFIGVNLGLITGRGSSLAGEIFFDDLNVPRDVYDMLEPAATRLDVSDLNAHLAPRAKDAHKGSHGHVLLIGGNHGMAGAIAMAAESALRAGSGLITVATRAEHAGLITMRRPELMVRGVSNAADLQPLIERASTIVIGPGLGQDAWAQELWEAAKASGLPMLVDADALNLLAKSPVEGNWVLTPHPAEAARLLRSTTADVQADRPAAVRAISKQYGGVAVLKGAGSLIAGDALAVCPYGNPGMGVGGMGDVLSGVIGALIAQGLALETAAQMGVMVHALAGDDAAAAHGQRGLAASDLFTFIQRRVNPCQTWT